jgi:hypothetical protein
VIAAAAEAPPTIGPMFAAPVWHYWIGVSVAVLAVLSFVVYAAMYVRKTQAPKYPGNR